MTSLSVNIKLHRHQRNLTTTKLAELSGISRPQLTKLENGKQKNPSIETLVALSTALGVSIEELVFGETTESNEIKTQLKIVNQLNKEQKQVVTGFLKGWLLTCKMEEMNK